MPATAGRVRMPANNRVHSSAALQTHGIWQSAIGYDPYAPDQNKQPQQQHQEQSTERSSAEQNTYDSFQGLLALARLTGSNADEARGSCKKCGRVGHLTFQCRNFLSISKKEDLRSPAPVIPAPASETPRGRRKSPATSESSDEEDEESELSDSSEDSAMERAIIAKFGKNILRGSKIKSSKREQLNSPRHKRSSKSQSKRNALIRESLSLEEGSSELDEKKVRRHHRRKSKSNRKYRDESDLSDTSSGDKQRDKWSSQKHSDASSDDEPEGKITRSKHPHTKKNNRQKDERYSSSDDGGERTQRHSRKRKHARHSKGISDEERSVKRKHANHRERKHND